MLPAVVLNGTKKGSSGYGYGYGYGQGYGYKNAEKKKGLFGRKKKKSRK